MTPPPRPTPGELEILRVLWERGPSTVREVQESLGAARAAGYTTVLKLLQIMADKGLVTRDETARAHVYAARAPETQTQRQLVRDPVDRAFGGSAAQLVVRLFRPPRAGGDRESIRKLWMRSRREAMTTFDAASVEALGWARHLPGRARWPARSACQPAAHGGARARYALARSHSRPWR